MPPKAQRPANSAKGRTKKQVDEDDLSALQKMAQEVFEQVRTRSGAASASKGGDAAAAKRPMPGPEELQRFMMQRRALEMEALAAAQVYHNIFTPLTDEQKAWQPLGGDKWMRFEQFRDERMDEVVALFSAELSEPYSAFTYEHFLGGWPDLGILAFGVTSPTAPTTDTVGTMIGCAVSKISKKRAPPFSLRGYIAMLAVAKPFRGHKIGQRLVRTTVELMRKKECHEVLLETPVTNERALNLYLDIGFAKTKYLTRYYLDGSDAVRLKLWNQDPIGKSSAAVGR